MDPEVRFTIEHDIKFDYVPYSNKEKVMAKFFSGSWKTTLGGVLVAIGILATQIGYALDTDPNTTMSWEAVLAAIGIATVGVAARDNNKSSEDVKVK